MSFLKSQTAWKVSAVTYFDMWHRCVSQTVLLYMRGWGWLGSLYCNVYRWGISV